MTNKVNNFTSLNLTNLEESILTTSYVLKLFCKNYNIRVVQLETPDGNLVAFGEGFSIIPNLKKLCEKKIKIGCELPFCPELVDTQIDYKLLSGVTVTIRKSPPLLLSAIVENWNGDILYSGIDNNLSTLLSTIEKIFQKQDNT